jgi:hypothetical protein
MTLPSYSLDVQLSGDSLTSVSDASAPVYTLEIETRSVDPSGDVFEETVEVLEVPVALVLPPGALMGYVWDGDSYVPQPNLKVFVGPVDPATVPGVVVTDQDQWVQTTS